MGRLWDIIARWVIVTGAVSGHRPRHHCWLLGTLVSETPLGGQAFLH